MQPENYNEKLNEKEVSDLNLLIKKLQKQRETAVAHQQKKVRRRQYMIIRKIRTNTDILYGENIGKLKKLLNG